MDSFFQAEMKSELRGISTGWKNLDPFYKVIPGEVTIVTGVPNSGKSEFIDALMVNLSLREEEEG